MKLLLLLLAIYSLIFYQRYKIGKTKETPGLEKMAEVKKPPVLQKEPDHSNNFILTNNPGATYRYEKPKGPADYRVLSLLYK